MKRILAAVLLTLAVAGCNTWERNTFNTLAASKAVVDTAQADYEAKTIPQSTCAYTAINDAKAAQTVAVNAMVVYEQLKSSKGNLTAQEAIVTTDLVALAPLVVQIQTMVANPTAPCTGAAK
jgi:hypothetical protein